MNKKSLRFILIIIIIIILGLIIVVLNFWALPRYFSPPEEFILTKESVLPEEGVGIQAKELVSEYESALKPILTKFFTQEEASSQDKARYLALIQDTQKEILKLTVPSKFRKLHLDLVIAFSQLEQGLENQEKFSRGQEILEKIKEEYPWLEN